MAVLFKNAFVLAFGAFRVSEQVSQAAWNRSTHALEITDARFTHRAFCLPWRHLKMDQTGKAALVLLREHVDDNLCPIQAVKAFLAIWNGEQAHYLHMATT